MLKKCTFTVLFTVLAMAGVANAAYSGTPTPEANFATETINNKTCYKIGSAEDLYGFAAIVNSGKYTACGVLTADITVNAGVLTSTGELSSANGFIEWTPIGNANAMTAFKGTFYGQGHTISGLYFNNTNADYVGLFANTSGTVSIDGVGVVDSYFQGRKYVGGLVGYHYKQSSLKLSVNNSYNAGSVNGTENVGGLVGYDAVMVSVNNSYNTGVVNGTENVGGLVGANGDVYFSYNTGSVTGTSKVGGLVGFANSSQIIDCYNTGSVKEGEGVGNALLGNGCVAGTSTNMNNSYYLEGSGVDCGPSAFLMTAEEFANGSVALKLHNNNTPTAKAGAIIWGQRVGTDKTPVLTGEIVFPITLDNSDNCYEISSADDLYIFAAIVNSDSNSSACGKLTDDIVVNENVLGANNANVDANGVFIASTTGLREWTPIGYYHIGDVNDENDPNYSVPFLGTFDGQGHTISGLFVNGGDKDEVGLFGLVGGSNTNVSISNVGVEDSYFMGSSNAGIGGIVGYVGSGTQSVNLENVYSTAYVVSAGLSEDDDAAYVGGIVGDFCGISLNITNAYNAGFVKGTNGFFGGLVGEIYASDNSASTTIKNSFSYGTVSCSGECSEEVLIGVTSADEEEGVKPVTPVVTNTFYLGSSSSGAYGTVRSEDDFSNGNVLAALQSAEGGEVWRQYSSDFYPTFVKKTAKTFEPNAEGYYEIATADDLYKFAEIVNNGTVPDAKAKLVADIVVNQNVLKNASGESCVNDDGSYNTTTCPDLRVWTPIGTSANAFKGTFDGQGHTISGLYVNKPQGCSGGCTDNENIGLFGTVANATVDGTVYIRNVGVEDSYFAGHAHIGGIVGDFNASGNLNIENSYSVGTIYAAAQSGGLVGYIQNTNVKIENSYSYGDFKCRDNCGALVGPLNTATANVVNSFYLEGVSENWSGDFGFAVADSAAFKNGTVALLLHGEGASVWGQKVGTDSHPNFYKGIEGASPSENGPGVIENGSLSSITVTLHYSKDATDTSKFEHVVGIIEKLPATDKKGNFVLGWYKNASFEGDKYVEVPTAEDDLDFYAKIMEVVEGCYQIADAEMLFEFADMVNNQNEVYGGACAKLTEDIEVNKNVLTSAGELNTAPIGGFIEWTPIGAGDSPFAGTFDGNGHSISGLYFNDVEKSSVGLFGYVTGRGKTVSISNVGVEDSYFKAFADVGGIVGVVGNETTLNIENVYNAATVVVDEDGFDVGGIVGDVTGGLVSPTVEIKNAYNVGTIIGDCVGGLVGSVDEANSVDITNSYNYGSVVCSYEECDQGALVGYVDGAKVAVTNSYYLGDAAQGDYGTVKSEDDFSDGAVYAALHSAEDGDVWFQSSGDKYPTLSQEKNGPAVYEVTLNYPKAGSPSEYDSETISYVEGFAKSLPTMDKNGNPILGWYTTGSASSPITEISASTSGAMTLFPKMYEPAADGCYEIATANQLYLFAAVVNNGKATACARLTANIVVNGNVLGTDNANVDANGNYIGSATGLREWTPIGSSSSNPFAGIFDGQGHSISGLYFNDANANDVGLFGVVAASAIDTIRNVGVVDSYFKGGDNVGAVTGRIACTSTCSVAIEASFNESVVVGNDNVGGIIGDVNGGAKTLFYLFNAYNVGTVIGSGDFGGLVGSAEADVYGSVANVFNYGTVSNGGGNIVGALDGSSSVGIGFSYYLGNGDGANSATEFADGTVLAKLQKHGGVYIWKQGEKYPVFGSYEPNADGCYEIANASQLYWFAAIVNNGNTNACGKLVADIEVNENVLGIGNANVNADGEYIGSDSASFSKWTPIGNSSNPFTGSFDGQGYTISGLYFNGENVYDVGLFGRVAGDADGASVANVNVADSYFGDKGEAGNHVGGVVGMVTHGGDVDVMNVSSAAVVVGNDDVGGIVGYVLGTEGDLNLDITNAYNVGMVKGSSGVGGLVGDVTIDREENKIAINNSYNYGDVSYKMNNGGAPLIGSVKNTADVATIEVNNSYYLGTETAGGYGTNKSADEFADGTVLIALRSGEDGYVWVQAPGDKYPTIDINATNAKTVVLTWTSAADSTTLAAAGYTDGAVVVVKDGKKFYADGNVYEGILSAEQVEAIGTNKLYPVSGLDLKKVDDKLVAYLDGDSYETLMIPTDVVVDKVIYKRDVPKMTFSTIMLPFSVPVASVSKHSFYKLKRVAEDDPDYHYAVKVSTITKTVAANRPYIMIDSTGSKQIEFVDVGNKLTLNTTTGTMEVTTTTEDGITWTTKGVYEYRKWQEDDDDIGSVFVFAAQAQNGYRIGQFAKIKAGASLMPMRLYLKTEKTASKGAPGHKFSSIVEMPETIGIEIEDDDEIVEEEKPMVVKNITIVPKASKSNNWFDVNGRALGQKPTAKGTYYHNGQRVIIKR